MSITDIIDPDVDLTKLSSKELDAYAVNMLRRHNIVGRKHHEEGVKRAYKVAELHSRAIFIQAAGSMPVKLKDMIEEMLLSESPIEETPDE